MDNNELVRLAQNGSRECMEQLILRNEGLIRSIIKRFLGRGTEAEDLYQIGCVGMLKAIKNFKFDKNVMFSTYAVPVIMGEIRRFLRDDGIIKISRSIKETARKVCAQTEIFSHEHDRQPTVSELAKILDLSVEEVTTAISASAMPVSIYEQSDDSDTPLIDKIIGNEGFDEKIVDTLSVTAMTKNLPPRERQIIIMRYFENKTQSEIAKTLEISQAQVSRIEKNVLCKLRCQLI